MGKKAASRKLDPARKEDITVMALSLFDRVRQIKKDNPKPTRKIDTMEREIRARLEGIREAIANIPDQQDRDLVTILVINGLHRTADEVLIDD